ncbi:MAG: hypothetical protein CSA68_07320 [Rhodobacterales bacterium]|nr:MAG: hypothetical protein CSA68_07320 [Rhodobacterales bacterium]
MDCIDKTSAKFQDEILQLALKAHPGSAARRFLCQAGSWYPTHDSIDGGLERQEVFDFLQRINTARAEGCDPTRSLREMRNTLEELLDRIDGFEHDQ